MRRAKNSTMMPGSDIQDNVVEMSAQHRQPAGERLPSAGSGGIFDAIDVPIVVVGLRCELIDFNQAAAVALGLSTPDLGRPCCDIQLLKDTADFQKSCAQAIAEGMPVRRDIRNGDRWFIARIAPYCAPGGQTDGAVITLTNVTAFRESLDKAIYEREYTKAILNTVIQPLVVLNNGLKVQTGNLAFYSLFKTTREQVHDVPLSDLGDCDWKASHLWASLEKTITGKNDFQPIEIKCEFPSIGHRTMLANARSLPFSGAEEILLVLTDITEQKHIQATLLEADRRKNEFLATLAHELRNPLAPIQNVVQVIRLGTPSDSDARWGNDVIDRQVQHLARLVDDLMDLSRITQGKIDLQFKRTPISEVIACAVETSRPLIDARNHQFTITVPHRPLFVNGDLVRLAQVLSNILNNSAKYTASRGKISLAVEAQGGEVIVRVQDNGVGIASEMLSSIFEMFVQAESAMELAQGGLGIGLTLAQRLTQLHAGRLEVASEGLQKGSVFTLRLPLHAEANDLPAHSAKDIRNARAIRAPRKILVADDNRDAADTLAMLLRTGGHDVCVVNDGLEAVEKAESNRPDVVFLDIGMPKLNGYDAARRIRAHAWGKAMTLVALTGWGQEEDRQRSVEAGFSHHLLKPINYSDLEMIVSI